MSPQVGQFYWPKGGQNYWPLTCADQEDIAWLRANGNEIDLRYLQAIEHPVAHEILPQETKFRIDQEEPPEPPAMERV